MVRSKIITIITVSFLLLMVMNLSSIAVMQVIPPPPGPPAVKTVTPVPHGGGGGGGGGSSYTPPAVIYPKYADVKDSRGNIIGNITQASASDISFWVLQSINVNGQTFTVRIDGKLNSLPSDAKVSIAGETPDITSLPTAITANAVLAQIDLSGFSSGWDIKSGSLKLTLILPQDMVGSADLSKSLIVRYDGTSYELLYPIGTPAVDNGNVTYVVVSPHESFSYNGASKYMLVTVASMPSPTPTPVPTEVPTAEPPQGPSLVTVLLALMLAAVVAAAFVLYFLMQRKQ